MRKVPVYLNTTASSYLGEVEIESPEEFLDAAEKIWMSSGYGSPTLCHQCSDNLELGDFEIYEGNLDYYFEDESKPKKQ